MDAVAQKPCRPTQCTPACLLASIYSLFRWQMTGLQSAHLLFAFFVCDHPPVLTSAPVGERNHGHATVFNGFTCWSAWGVSQNGPQLPNRGVPSGYAFQPHGCKDTPKTTLLSK